jgi:MHS family alpha-ketoglutarate permease-like MFS transporter
MRGELIREKGIVHRPSWRPVMTDQAIKPADDHFDIKDVERRVKAIFIGSVGNLVEWYDFYAYTAFALYFAPAFFPNSDPVVQQLNAAVLFAATFLMRPLGGWLFGFIADRHGRRLSLTLSVVCMCFGSLIIAVTPTYATIGIAAPAILALARIIEGLSLGGEYGASATYLTEVADPKHRGFYSSFQYVTLIGRPADRDHGAVVAAKGVPHARAAKGLGLANPLRDRRPARDLCRRHAA